MLRKSYQAGLRLEVQDHRPAFCRGFLAEGNLDVALTSGRALLTPNPLCPIVRREDMKCSPPPLESHHAATSRPFDADPPSGTPLPGRPVRGSRSGRPIMAALNLLSRRWVLRIIWELRNGPRGFREMQTLCEQMSPNTLSTRLSELKEAKVVAHDAHGNWALTPLGRQLGPALKELVSWASAWKRAVDEGSAAD